MRKQFRKRIAYLYDSVSTMRTSDFERGGISLLKFAASSLSTRHLFSVRMYLPLLNMPLLLSASPSNCSSKSHLSSGIEKKRDYLVSKFVAILCFYLGANGAQLYVKENQLSDYSKTE